MTRDKYPQVAIVTFDDLAEFHNENSPADDIDGIVIEIVNRGHFSQREAGAAARCWREADARYPETALMVAVGGYDDDPRELWQIPEARGFILTWARLAGMDDVVAVSRRANNDPATLFLLSSCGVFGEALRQVATTGKFAHDKQEHRTQ